VTRDGTSSPITELEGDIGYPRLSPDASKLAVAIGSDLWVLDLARGVVPSRVTFAGVARFLPLWTPDGQHLTHADGITAENRILVTASDGTLAQDTLLPLGPRAFPTSWSPDGRYLMYGLGPDGTATGSRDVRLLTRTGARTETAPFIETTFNERGAVLSPDGDLVAYVSDKSGRDEIYVRPFLAAGAEVRVSGGGGREPVWARSGDEIFYRSPTALVAASVARDASGIRVGEEQRLFADSYRRDASTASGTYANYDAFPNGDFVMLADPEPIDDSTLAIVLNWFEDLRARVPN
jgi:Tol biopolymer transport system component